MRNLGHTKRFLLMQKSDNGLTLPQIPSTWHALVVKGFIFLNTNAKGKIKSNCFPRNS